MLIDFNKIPHGIYCYDENGICPYWDSDPSKGEQNYGYCHYLKYGDWDNNGCSLLWDQVKECHINTDDEYDDINRFNDNAYYQDLYDTFMGTEPE